MYTRIYETSYYDLHVTSFMDSLVKKELGWRVTWTLVINRLFYAQDALEQNQCFVISLNCMPASAKIRYQTPNYPGQ